MLRRERGRRCSGRTVVQWRGRVRATGGTTCDALESSLGRCRLGETAPQATPPQAFDPLANAAHVQPAADQAFRVVLHDQAILLSRRAHLVGSEQPELVNLARVARLRVLRDVVVEVET